jgi:hypothetical protein
MKPSHFMDRKEWAINDGQIPLRTSWSSSLAITTESRISETLSAGMACYNNSSCGGEALGEKKKKKGRGRELRKRFVSWMN